MKSNQLTVTTLFQLVKDYTRFFQSDEIPDYDFLKLSTTHRKFDALMRRFWGTFHPLTKDIFTSFIFEVSTLLETVEDLNKEVSIKEREVQKVTKELNERREYIANLLEKLEDEVRTQLSLTEEEIQALEKESKAKSKMVEKLQQEVMMLKSELNSQSSLSSDAVTEAVLLDQKLNSYEQEINEQKEVIEKLTFDNLQLMEQNISLQRNSENLVQRIEDLEVKLGKANSIIQSLQEQLKTQKDENNKLKQTIVEFKADKVSRNVPSEEYDSFEQMMGKSELFDLKKDMISLTKVVKEELSQNKDEIPERPQKAVEEIKQHLLSVFDAIKSNDPTVDLYNLKEEIREVSEKDPYGLLPLIENLLSTALGNLMETKLEEIKRDFLIEKIQLQSEIVQLRNKIIDLTGSIDEPLKIKNELGQMFEKEREAPKFDVKPENDQEPPSEENEPKNFHLIPEPDLIEESFFENQEQTKSLRDELKEQLDINENISATLHSPQNEEIKDNGTNEETTNERNEISEKNDPDISHLISESDLIEGSFFENQEQTKSLRDELKEQLEINENISVPLNSHPNEEIRDNGTNEETTDEQSEISEEIDDSIGSLLDRFEKKLKTSKKWIEDED